MKKTLLFLFFLLTCSIANAQYGYYQLKYYDSVGILAPKLKLQNTRQGATTDSLLVKTQSNYEVKRLAINQLVIPFANVTGFTSSSVTTALGYTPESAITAGTTAQYWRGDKTWQDFNTSARGAISLTTTGALGTTPTYNSSTGVLNVPVGSTATVTSVGVTSSDFSVSGSPVTTSGNITLNLNTTGVSASTYDRVTVDTKGRVTAGFNRQTPVAIASGSKSFNTAYQVSTTNDAYLTVSPQISCNLSLSGGQAGTITLEISANGSSGWVLMGVVSGSNTGTLTIGLNTTQVSGAPMFAYVPAGYYYRMTTNSTTGSPTYTFNGGNYTLN